MCIYSMQAIRLYVSYLRAVVPWQYCFGSLYLQKNERKRSKRSSRSAPLSHFWVSPQPLRVDSHRARQVTLARGTDRNCCT